MTNASIPINNIAKALRLIRKSKGLSQEDFGLNSSRTYVSTLERGLKSPTLSKVDSLADVMNVHPLTLLVLSYMEGTNQRALNELLQRVASEVSTIELR